MRARLQCASYRFGSFEVDEHRGELRAEGRRIPLQQQPLQVLLILLRSPGELVTREELQHSIWPENTFVEFDSGLNTAVKKIRIALSDCANSPVYVETVPKRGYRFIAKVEVCADIELRQERPLGIYLWLAGLLLAFLGGFVCHVILSAH
jgi:DNA-binding winged helix-turn-helix (wHTH) protein